jgi:hypothetical protein
LHVLNEEEPYDVVDDGEEHQDWQEPKLVPIDGIVVVEVEDGQDAYQASDEVGPTEASKDIEDAHETNEDLNKWQPVGSSIA